MWRLVVCLVLLTGCASKDIRVRAAESAREAVLVLPGLGYETEGSKDIRRFARALAKEGYDVYVPDVQARRGLDAGVKRLDRYVAKHDLARYEKVHVFAFILGGYVLNRSQAASLPNLATVVFDRSPLQERAPAVSTSEMPRVSRMLMGQVVFDVANTPYPPFPRDDVKVGLVIESRATWFIRWQRKAALSLGPLTFDPDSFGQRHDDHVYVWLDHFEMYHRFDVVGPELRAFFATGKFTGGARREPFVDRDPFAKR